jgi:hypothetical protein
MACSEVERELIIERKLTSQAQIQQIYYMQNSNLQPQTKELFVKLDQSTKTNKDSLAASQELLEQIKKNNEENLQVLNQTTVV